MSHTWLWIVFNIFVLGMLAVDLGVLNRKAHVIGVREAARWTAAVVTAAAIFNFGIFYFEGTHRGLEFLTGYLIELALSVDNIFVFILIFSYFQVPRQYQHRVLFWGIFGALVMRGAMIGAGALLIQQFHWIIYVFGAFLVFTGMRMLTQDEEAIEPEANPFLKLMRRFMPISRSYDGQKFFTHIHRGEVLRRAATPLLVVLVLVETTDLIFAVDSIPAIFAVTQDAFLIYTSNVFAILGLRSMYFLLAGVIEKFHLLKFGLAIVLMFVGVKMLLTYFDLHIPILISLAVVAGVLTSSVVLSLLIPSREKGPELPGDNPPPPPIPDEASAGGG
ncbi:MAG TPA: TerC family protein [Longimicrobiaceae bacterium]